MPLASVALIHTYVVDAALGRQVGIVGEPDRFAGLTRQGEGDEAPGHEHGESVHEETPGKD